MSEDSKRIDILGIIAKPRDPSPLDTDWLFTSASARAKPPTSFDELTKTFNRLKEDQSVLGLHAPEIVKSEHVPEGMVILMERCMCSANEAFDISHLGKHMRILDARTPEQKAEQGEDSNDAERR